MYKGYENISSVSEISNEISVKAQDGRVDVSDVSFIRDADFSRDGVDLMLDGPDGLVRVEGYFSDGDTPVIVGPDGSALNPALVDSFLQSGSDYAQLSGLSDVSPVGTIDELTGEVFVTRVDGTQENVTMGTSIYEGDIIETSGDGAAANIVFIDETSFAVSENARLSIDEYVFDADTNEGATDFSVLKGLFVFTSGLIGREDPDDVTIETPIGSIGIRGTIIAGNVDSGEITVVEGAIVLRDLSGNEVTLADQFETAKFDPAGGGIEHVGVLSAEEVGLNFESVSGVSGELFSSVQDVQSDVEGDAIDSVDSLNEEPVLDVDEAVDSGVDADLDTSSDSDAPDESGAVDVEQGDEAQETLEVQDKEVAAEEITVEEPVEVLEAQNDEIQNNLQAESNA